MTHFVHVKMVLGGSVCVNTMHVVDITQSTSQHDCKCLNMVNGHVWDVTKEEAAKFLATAATLLNDYLEAIRG